MPFARCALSAPSRVAEILLICIQNDVAIGSWIIASHSNNKKVQTNDANTCDVWLFGVDEGSRITLAVKWMHPFIHCLAEDSRVHENPFNQTYPCGHAHNAPNNMNKWTNRWLIHFTFVIKLWKQRTRIYLIIGPWSIGTCKLLDLHLLQVDYSLLLWKFNNQHKSVRHRKYQV